MTLEEALDSVVAEIEVVAEARQDRIIKELIQSFKKSHLTKFDFYALLEEISDLATRVTFDAKAYQLDGASGLKQAVKTRIELQSDRDRLVSLMGAAVKSEGEVSRIRKYLAVYIRSLGLEAKTAKHLDDLSDVISREVVECYEQLRAIKGQITTALDSVDRKTRLLDAWFNLHKQYVFFSVDKGPANGEPEPPRSRTGSLGRKRQRGE